MQPAFKVGDAVCEKSEFARVHQDKGIVTSYYAYKGEYRYLVMFENGRERLMFERELIADSDRSPAEEHRD
jgi:hypothetical protein